MFSNFCNITCWAAQSRYSYWLSQWQTIGDFRTLTESTSLNWSPKNWHEWLRLRLTLLCTLWWKSVHGDTGRTIQHIFTIGGSNPQFPGHEYWNFHLIETILSIATEMLRGDRDDQELVMHGQLKYAPNKFNMAGGRRLAWWKNHDISKTVRPLSAEFVVLVHNGCPYLKDYKEVLQLAIKLQI